MVCEVDLFAATEVADDLGGEDLAGLGAVADAGGELDGAAEVVVVFGDRFAGVEADADADLAADEVALDLEGSFYGTDGGAKGSHDAVAGVFDLFAVVVGEGLADGRVVAVKDCLGLVVADGLGGGGGGLEVGEEDGAEG